MSDKVLIVSDLIRALSKLPPDAKLVHYDCDPSNNPIMLTRITYDRWNAHFYIERHGDEVWLCTAYDNEPEEGAFERLDFSE